MHCTSTGEQWQCRTQGRLWSAGSPVSSARAIRASWPPLVMPSSCRTWAAVHFCISALSGLSVCRQAAEH